MLELKLGFFLGNSLFKPTIYTPAPAPIFPIPTLLYSNSTVPPSYCTPNRTVPQPYCTPNPTIPPTLLYLLSSSLYPSIILPNLTLSSFLPWILPGSSLDPPLIPSWSSLDPPLILPWLLPWSYFDPPLMLPWSSRHPTFILPFIFYPSFNPYLFYTSSNLILPPISLYPFYTVW